MKARAAFLFVVHALSLSASADEQVRSTQEELRRRRIYFGDVDGRQTPELEAAMRRYQKRKGFTPSGSADQDTMRSLGLVPRSPDEPPPKELSWPEEPVLKSDTSIDVGAAAEEIEEETGVSAASIAPEIVAERTWTKPGRKVVAIAPKKKRAKSGTTGAAPGAAAGRMLIGTDQRLDAKEVRRFVSDYLDAVDHNDLRDELRFYADRVDYYHNGTVDRRIIEHTLRNYYQRWPKRKYSMGRAVNFSVNLVRAEIVVTYSVEFYIKNSGRRIKGRTDNRVVINAATADPRIVKIEERRRRD